MSCDCSITPNSALKAQPQDSQDAQDSTRTGEPVSQNILEARGPAGQTEMLPKENIECYARRAATVGKNDVAEKIVNKIDNTSISCDLNNYVDEQFKLTPGSNRVVERWKISVDGQDETAIQLSRLKNLQFSNGRLVGTLGGAYAGRTFKVLIAAEDSGGEIDSREYNLTVKSEQSTKVKFLFPYEGNGRVTCSFGPRNPPKPGASSIHKGIDISQPGTGLGYILSSADGVVTKCGPASGYGNWVVIEHRDAFQEIIATTVYGHMNEIYVTVGQRVAAGQRIAKEGNAGIGTAAHLHFEIHKGKFGNPVDPIPYLNGEISVAQNNLKGQLGIPDERSFTRINNQFRGMSKDEKPEDCPSALPESTTVTMAPTEVADYEAVRRTLNEDESLDEEDKIILSMMASSQSGFNSQYSRQDSSSIGIFQMIDRAADKFFSKIGLSSSRENRTDAESATRAQIQFYKDEMLKYWEEFNDSKLPGPATIAGKKLTSELSNKYSTLSKGEFIYGLIYHDGVNNAIAGRDRQGVDAYRKRLPLFTN
jgi:murein DD-endopeptidase MepM/ murein hydrolase activator NlpD